jgi:hypothetical protein
MDEVITLIEGESRREVLCVLRSVGHAEFYEAQSTDYRPELKFVLDDYLDYEGETLVKHDGTLYRVIRTYRAGQALEITVGRASAEEAAIYG